MDGFMGDNKEIAIKVEDVVKTYKLYASNRNRMADTFGLGKKKQLYTPHNALNGINLDIYKGETIGIIGTNGSGKSTLLKIITGVLNPTSGSVTVNGRISALLELGAGFNREYNGIENVFLNGTMMGFSDAEIKERLPEILKFADIGDYVYQPVKTYSSGMFVRLAFAVAINIDPEILIVDEALSVGDVFFQSKCYHKFEEFKKAGKTIIFVSHDLSSIAKYCDRVMVLNKGDKVSEGAPKEMIDIYKRILVGQYDAEDTSEYIRPGAISGVNNPNVLEYGSKEAEYVDITLYDDKNLTTDSFIKGSEFTIKLTAKFKESVNQPIFAFTVKNVKGTEICGTNTMYERVFFDTIEAGKTVTVSFTQRLDLQGGEYILSFGLTGYKKDEFTVYHRLYDAVSITVISEQNKEGFYDMNSRITTDIK